MRAGCPGMLLPCRAEVGQWPMIASTRRRREIRHYEHSGSCDGSTLGRSSTSTPRGYQGQGLDLPLALSLQGALAKGYQPLEQRALLRTEQEDLRHLLRRR